MTIVGSKSDVSDTRRPQPPSAIPSPAPAVLSAPARLTIPTSDWDALVATRANTVVVGNEDAALGLLTAIWPTLQKPTCWVDAGRLSLPRQSAGTVILESAHALSRAAQQQVFEWLDRDARATRVLTTTPHSLFPLVEDGSFLEALYYRLNMLLLVL